MIEKKYCMGCKACVEICPKQCIELSINENGVEEIRVNSSKCIECGLCNRVCQLENTLVLKNIESLYVATQKREEKIGDSTSAGAASLIAEKFIESGGLVAGVIWDGNRSAKYELVETVEALYAFKGSKYVYPEINEIYKKVKVASRNREVLFIGLPCHVAALYKFLNGDDENIFTIDLICHGAPQATFLNEHLKCIGLSDAITNITFREGPKYKMQVSTRTATYSAEHYRDVYLYGFLNGLLQKEYCYECRYAYEQRTGDITLGDAWNQKLIDSERTSLIALNSKKGEQMFEGIKEDLVYVAYDLNDFKNNNSQLKAPTKKHCKRAMFAKVLQSDGFEKAVTKALSSEMKKLQFRKKLSSIKRMIQGDK